jgi:hypothetical protein
MSDHCKLELGNVRFVRECYWKNEIAIDISEYESNIPTKKGIRLPLGRWKIWEESTEAVDDALSKGSTYSLHLGGSVYCKVAEHGVCIDIHQYWSPPNQDGVISTKREICPRPSEYRALKNSMSIIEGYVPEVNGVVPCYIHQQNQLEYLQCPGCNPNDI